MTADRFDLGRFKRAVYSRREVVREDADSITFRIPYSEFLGWYDAVKPRVRWDDETGNFVQSFDQSEQLARRKLVDEAERYGEVMHEDRE